MARQGVVATGQPAGGIEYRAHLPHHPGQTVRRPYYRLRWSRPRHLMFHTEIETNSNEDLDFLTEDFRLILGQ